MSINDIIAIIKSAPRLHGGKSIHWAADIHVPIEATVFILNAKDSDDAIAKIHEATGAALSTLRHLIRGNRPDGNKWPALREALSARGIKWRMPFAWRNDPAPPAAEVLAPAAFTVAIKPDKPATLAVTNKGEVITAAPPVAATTPTTMVAQAGDFAVKTNTTRCVIDANTGDILIITTRRVLYGSPEHRAKMIEMNAKKA